MQSRGRGQGRDQRALARLDIDPKDLAGDIVAHVQAPLGVELDRRRRVHTGGHRADVTLVPRIRVFMDGIVFGSELWSNLHLLAKDLVSRYTFTNGVPLNNFIQVGTKFYRQPKKTLGR